ncbi:MAG: ArsR family transcriptional regulator [Proteobacteria bacterium]|nr:ArsR family transcriptional regulator [Pseudomonadota bacterium]MBU1736638.1 ArsR family transcriptional regulator [Pseudomonadota bacterium]
MADVARISVQNAREKVAKGQALLVCAYESDDKFSRFHLEGAISLSEFRRLENDIDRGRELIFYCA